MGTVAAVARQQCCDSMQMWTVSAWAYAKPQQGNIKSQQLTASKNAAIDQAAVARQQHSVQ